MNVVFPFIPEGSTTAIWIIVGVMAVMGVGLTLLFRHRKWWF
jgi:Mg2+ and Co2+ transporter CorA